MIYYSLMRPHQFQPGLTNQKPLLVGFERTLAFWSSRRRLLVFEDHRWVNVKQCLIIRFIFGCRNGSTIEYQTRLDNPGCEDSGDYSVDGTSTFSGTSTGNGVWPASGDSGSSAVITFTSGFCWAILSLLIVWLVIWVQNRVDRLVPNSAS